MARYIRCVLLVLASWSGATQLLAQPANDNFTNAIPLVGSMGTAVGTTTGATREPGEPNHFPTTVTGRSVWYTWTAPATGPAVFDTIGSSFDTVLAIYTGATLANLTLIVNDDDSGGNFTSRAVFNAQAGTTYDIAIDGYDNGLGTGPANGPYRLNFNAGTNFVAPGSNVVQFAATSFSVAENTPGFADILIAYGGGGSGGVTVDFTTMDGTALAGTNYNTVTTTVSFGVGQSIKVVTVPILDDAVVNSNRTVVLKLSNPTGGALLGALSNVVLTIVDNETQPFVSAAGEFNFSQPIYIVTEDETVPAPFPGSTIGQPPSRSARGALIMVTRTLPASGKVTVDVDVSAGTATPGVEFTPTTTTLVFDDYQMSATFLVPVFSDGIPNGDKTIILTLLNPLPDPQEDPATIIPTIGAGSVSTIGILEVNTRPGNTYSIERRTYRMDEYDPLFVLLTPVGEVQLPTNSLAIDILNPSGVAGTVSLRVVTNLYGFALVDGSDYADGARPPDFADLFPNPLYTDGSPDVTNRTDFYGVSVAANPQPQRYGYDPVLSFGNNEFRKTVRLIITNDAVVEFNEDVLLLLHDPDGGHTIRNATANVTIMFDEQSAGSADREWDPEFVSFTQPPFYTTPGANSIVAAVAVQQNDNRAVLVGDFTAVNSVSRFRVARMLPDGALDLGFNPGSGADAFVEAVVIIPTNSLTTLGGTPNPTNVGKILVGGGFTTFNNISRHGIARLNPNGTLDNTFNPGNGADGTVHSIALQNNGKILVTGDFTHFNDVAVTGIIRLNEDGTIDPTFDPGTGANGAIWAVAVRDTPATIFAPRAAAGTELEDVNVIETGSDEGILTIVFDFLSIPDNIRVFYDGVRLLDLTTNGTGTLNIPFGPGLGTTITIIMNQGIGISGTLWSYQAFVTPVIRDRTIYIGGEFTEFNGVTRRGLARLRDDGSLDTRYDPGLGVNGPVYAIALQPNNKLIAGGSFTRFHTSDRNSIVRTLNNGLLDEDYNVGTGADGAIYSIVLQRDNKAFIGGAFNNYNGTRRVGLARLFVGGSLDTSFLDTAYNQFAGLIKTFSFDNTRFVNSIALCPPTESYAFQGTNLVTNVVENIMIGGSFTNLGGNFSISHPLRNNYTVFTRADKCTRYNIARLNGGYTPGPGNIEFDPTAFPFTIDENSGVFYATMRRVDGRLGTIQVIGTNFNNTASTPVDFTPEGLPQIWPEFAYVAPISVGYVGPNYFANPITEDMLQEGDETFGVGAVLPTGSITLGGEVVPLGGALSHVDRSQVTIADNDFSHGEFNFVTSLYFTNENARFATITVIRTNGSVGAASVDYFTRTGGSTPATAGVDYTSVRNTLSFNSGQTSRTFLVPITDDAQVEFDETVTLVLTNATGGAQLPGGTPASIATSTLRIIDNDFLAGRLNFAENFYTNNENETFATISVARSGGNRGALTVQVRTSDGTATAPQDYAGVTNTLSWPDADSSLRTFTIPLVTDGLVEGDETVNLVLFNSSVSGALGARTNAVLVIADADRYGVLSFNQPSYSAQENGFSPTITVVRSGGIAGTVSVVYATASLSAAPGSDYNDVSGVLTFLPGETSKTFAVPLIDDTVPDGNKTLSLVLSNFVNASSGAFTNVVLTIIDNESFNVPAGSVDTEFSEAAQANDAVYALALQPDGRLIMAGDFTEVNRVPRIRMARLKASGQLDESFNIGPGANASIRTLALQPDGRLLIGGLFSIVNSTNRNGIARLQADGSMDAFFNPGAGADAPVYAIALQGDDKILVGGSFSTFNGITRPGIVRLNTNGTVDLNFNVGAGAEGTVFAIAVQNDGKILVGGDFVSFNGFNRTNLVRLNRNGTLDTAFHPTFGTNSSVHAVLIQADGKIVIGGSFTNVSDMTRGYMARFQSDGTLDSTFLNGVRGADFTVFALAQQIDGKILAAGDFKTFNGVTRSGLTRVNTDGSTDPTINFGSGANSFVAALVLQPDDKIVIGGGFTLYNDEPHRHIARLYGGSLAGSGALEFEFSLFVTNESSTNAAIIVSRRGGTTGEARVDAFTTTNGSAVAGVQYLSVSHTLVFPEGETRQIFNVPLIPNDVPDGDRTVDLGLGSYINAAVGPDPRATLLVLDDEAAVGFSTATYSANENAFNGHATVDIIRTGGTNTPFTVDIATVAGGTATPGADYIATNATLTFAPGEVRKLFDVRVIDDTVIERDESIFLALSNPSGTTTLGISAAVIDLHDNDSAPGQFLFATNNFGGEEAAGFGNVIIIRTNGYTGLASVRLSTAGGTATPFADYIPTNIVVAFGNNESVKVVAIALLNDSIAEPDETVNLVLSDPTGGATIIGSNAMLTIIDDEVLPSFVGFQTNNFFVNEFAGFATINIVRTNSRRGVITVNFSVSDGSATAGVDYLTTNGTVTLNDGEDIKAFLIPIIDDTEGEGTETVRLSLSNLRATNATLTLPTATLNILDDDTTLRFTSATYTVAENGGAAAITVERVGVTNTAVSVTYSTTPGGTGIGGIDYVPVTGTLNWAVNDGAPKTFNVPIIDNNIVNVNTTVFLILTNPVGISTYVTGQTNAVLTIIDDDTAPPTAGPVDPLFNDNFGAAGSVRSLAYDERQRLYVAGDFTQFHGLAVNRITRLTTNGAVDIGFNVGNGANALIYSVAATTNGAYIGGQFTSVNGVARNRIARLLPDGTVDAAFNPGTGANAPVRAVAIAAGGQVVIGGEFTIYNGNQSPRIARLDPTGALDPTFNVGSGANAIVRAVAVQPNGQVLIGGDFTVVEGFLVTRIARLNTDGTLDTTFDTGLGADASVNSIAVQSDGKILIGGVFVTINGVPRNRVARLNANGSVDTTFDIGTGADAVVRAVAAELDNHVLVSGAFTNFNGNPLRGVARLNPDGTLDAGFMIGSGADAQVNSLGLVPRILPPTIATMTFNPLLPDGTAYTSHLENSLALRVVSGGAFLAVSNPPFATGARMSPAFPLELTLAGGFTFTLQSLYVTNVSPTTPLIVTASTGASVLITNNGTFFFGPGFVGVTSVQIASSAIAVIDNLTALPGADAFTTPSFAAGGDFEKFNEVQRGGVVVLTSSGTADRTFDPRNIPTRTVYAAVIHTNRTQPALVGRVVVGGDFTAIVGVDGVNRIARLNIDGTLDRTFNGGSGPNGPVRAVAVQPDGKIIFGGLFTTYDVLSRAYLARANADGTLDNTFNFGVGLNNAVLAMGLQPDGRIVIGGTFTEVYGAPRSSIARVHTNGTVDVNFNPGTGANGAVKAVALQSDGKVLIGGDFTLVNGVSRFHVARLNANGTVDMTFNPGAGTDGAVNAIAVTATGGVLIGGAFTNFNGLPAPRVALLTGSGAADGSFNPGAGANDYLASIQVQADGQLVIAGNFTRFNGQVRNRIARLNADGSLDPTINFGRGANDVINTLALQDYDGKIVIGGSFTEVDGLTRVAVARLIAGTNSGGGTFRFSAPAFTVNENAGSAVIAVLRAGGTFGPATVSFSTANGTATSPADYTATSGTLTFAPAENVKFITVPVADNAGTNVDKTFTVSLFGPSPGTSLGVPSNAVVTIADNDSVIAFSSPSYQVNENGGVARITVTRTGGATDTATVEFATGTTGSATAGLDFVPVSGTLVFAPGVRRQTFDVPIVDDALNEFNETVPLTLLNERGALLGLSSATLTIVENDFSAGVIAFGTNSYVVSEDAGSIAIEVLRLNGFSGAVTVGFQTPGGGTATANLDYVATNGTIAFADGQTNAFLVLRPIDDALSEGDESFPVQLFGPSGGATLGLATATVTIADNDAPGTFVFSAPLYTVSESNSFVTITVIRTNGNLGAVSVVAQTSGGTATPTVDYGPVSNLLNFANGQTVRQFTIPIFQDALIEGTETVDLLLSDPMPPGGSPNGPSIGNPRVATLQIIDDEVAVGFSATDFSVIESTTNVTITVVRTGDTNRAFSVTVNTSDGTATAGADYFTRSLTLFFAPGVTNQSFMVPVLDDQLAEGDEFLNLTLSSPSSGVILGPISAARLNILDNDTAFNFSAANYSVVEGNFGLVNVTVTVVRSGFIGGADSVDFGTFDGTASAFAFDYLATAGTLNFAAGQTTAVFFVSVAGDTLVENNETVILSLSNPSTNTFLGRQSSAVLTIIDDDTSIGFSQTNFVVNEKATNALITLVRNGAAAQAISVTFRTTNGTATAGADYGAVSNIISWAANDVAPKTVLVPIFDDAFAEGAETVLLQLLNPVNATIDFATGTATLTIVDDAGVIAFASVNYSAVEGASNAVINLVRTGGSNGTVSVTWNVVGGSATAGSDYFGTSGTVQFAGGETTKPILLPMADDALAEGVETVNLVLSSADGGARVGSPNAATLSIIDNDTGIIVGSGTALVAESITPANGVIDPGETVTLLLALRNAGVVDANNVSASIVFSNGITGSPQTQNYGALLASGSSASRAFAFTAQGTNGSRITVTLLVTNAGLFLGPVSFDFVLGRQNVPFQNANVITINDNAAAAPYPATLLVSGLGGPVNHLTVTLNGVSHNFPDDLDILLVGPNGAAVMLMSDAGGGLANALNNVTITFDDDATAVIPDSTRITNGTYRCANYLTQTDPFPGFPNNTVWNNTTLATFNGINPNGVWSLYVVDDASQQAGLIAGGWSLRISTADPVVPGADLGVTVTDAPDPVVFGGTITYTITVANYGPATATSVMLTNLLPAGTAFSSVSGPGSYGLNGNVLVGNLGSLAINNSAVVTVRLVAPAADTLLTFDASVSATEADGNPGNNSVSIKTRVSNAAADVPPLFAARKNGQLVLSWQSAATNVVLQSSTLAGSGSSWSNMVYTPVVSNGVSTATMPIAGGTKFFRLSRNP